MDQPAQKTPREAGRAAGERLIRMGATGSGAARGGGLPGWLGNDRYQTGLGPLA